MYFLLIARNFVQVIIKFFGKYGKAKNTFKPFFTLFGIYEHGDIS